MNIFAHRGFSMLYPENTIIAFEKAAQLPIYGVEFDVHLTADQQPVIIHDESINRTSNGQGFVKDLTLQQLQAFDYGSWFNPVYAEETIPTLSDVLQIFQHTHHVINIELKSDIFEYTGIEEIVFHTIKQFKMEERVIISSFNHETLQRFNKLAPSIKTATLFSSLVLNLENYVKNMNSSALHIAYFHTERKIIQHALQQGATVRTFTVNDVKIAKQLQKIGVSAIFTDDPQLMLNQL